MLGLALLVFVIVVVIGMSIFGAFGALLAESKGGDRGVGLVFGALLGPIGLIFLWIQYGSRPKSRDAFDMARYQSSRDDAMSLPSTEAEPDRPIRDDPGDLPQ